LERIMDRRDFLRHTAAGLAAGWGASALAQDTATKLTATTVRAIGNTGVTCTLLGMGTGVKSWNGSSELNRKGREATEAMLEHAYAKGIRYFDMADMYGIHQYMQAVLKRSVKREEVTLLTKVVSKEGPQAQADLERFRKELDTDYLDMVLMHCMTDADWPTKMQPVMDVLAKAKADGVVKAHGVSCHSLDALKRAAETDWVDVVLARINPFGVRMDAPAEEVVPVLRQLDAAGKGLLGMKILGEGQVADKMAESMDFVLRLGCIDAMTIGFLTPDEVDGAVAQIDALAIPA